MPSWGNLRVKIDHSLLHTGIPVIDRQHEAYANLVNRVFALCEQQQANFATMRVEVDQVLSYAMEHFDSEEQLMRSAKYPQYEGHVARHNVFREQADGFAAELAASAQVDDFTIRLARSLVNWFIEHVQSEDLRLAAFLRTQGRVSAS